MEPGAAVSTSVENASKTETPNFALKPDEFLGSRNIGAIAGSHEKPHELLASHRKNGKVTYRVLASFATGAELDAAYEAAHKESATTETGSLFKSMPRLVVTSESIAGALLN